MVSNKNHSKRPRQHHGAGTPSRSAFNPKTLATLTRAAVKLAPYAIKAGKDAYRHYTKPRARGAKSGFGGGLTTTDIGAGGEKTFMKVRAGSKKKMSTHRYVTKLVKSSIQSNIWRWSAINPYMNTTVAPRNVLNTQVGGGAYALQNGNDAVGSNLHVPLHMFDLTSANNFVQGTYIYKNPSYMPVFQNSSGSNITWSNMVTDTNNGAVGSNWNIESTTGTASSFGTSPYTKANLDYVEARLLCYGAANMATDFSIDLVQIKEDYMHPGFVTNTSNLNSNITSNADYANSTIAVYESLLKPYVAHPLNSINPRQAHSHFKVLKSIKFTLQPRLSNETDANVGHCKQVNLFWRANRTLKFDWGENLIDPQLSGQVASAYKTWIGNNGMLQTSVVPKARVYLMVRATNPTNVNYGSSAPTVLLTPSYDILLRQKLTQIE